MQGSRRSLLALNRERQQSARRGEPQSPAISSVQLRRTRAAVAEQAALTSSARQALAQMQLGLQIHEEKCYA